MKKYLTHKKSPWGGIIGNEAEWKKRLEISYGVGEGQDNPAETFMKKIGIHKSEDEINKSLSQDLQASGSVDAIRQIETTDRAMEQKQKEADFAAKDAAEDKEAQKKEDEVKWDTSRDGNIRRIVKKSELSAKERAAIDEKDLVPDSEKVHPHVHAKEVVFDAMERKIFIALKSAIYNMDIDLKTCQKKVEDAGPAHAQDPEGKSKLENIFKKAKKITNTKHGSDHTARKNYQFSDDESSKTLQLLRDALINMASDMAEEFEGNEIPEYYEPVQNALMKKRGFTYEEVSAMYDRCRITHFQVQVFIESFFKHVEETLGCKLHRNSTKVANAAESKTRYALKTPSTKIVDRLNGHVLEDDLSLNDFKDNTTIDMIYQYFRGELHVRYESRLMELFNVGRSLFFRANELMYDLEEIGSDFDPTIVGKLREICDTIHRMYDGLKEYPRIPKDLEEDWDKLTGQAAQADGSVALPAGGRGIRRR